MLVGVPKEIKTHEYRVGMRPAGVRQLCHNGHDVIVETGAGMGIGYDDAAYEAAGARIAGSAKDVFDTAEMIVKVKEPQAVECDMLREGQVLFTYLHLAADKSLTERLLASGAVAIAYETVTGTHSKLPLLAPMSEVAGRMSIQVGAHFLEKEQGGAGVLLGGVSGVEPAKVCVVGGGVSGVNAARMAMGLLADVTILDISLPRLDELDMMYGGRLNTVYSTVDSIEEHVTQADLVIGAVLVPGAAAPKLVTEAMIKQMRAGSVLVDIAIDQGGCFETSHPTSHDEPVYRMHDVIHYCVTNMPGAVARTSTDALNNATLPYTIKLANDGYKKALAEDPHLLEGLNLYQGRVTYEAVARDLDLNYAPAADALGIG
ncbi:MAG: alanine dehydrogenase [Pseudomonadota bacterium]